ncbi:MAG: peptidase BlaR1 [Gemmatimonadetes bacterium]|nr:peptidase BlaR1 [Gemmatimonadota bacterium]
MIAAWMIYTTAVTLLLFAGAYAADYVVRSLGVPARFVWAAAMIAALALSGRALARGTETKRVALTPIEQSPRFTTTIGTVDGPAAIGPNAAITPPNGLQSLLIEARAVAARLRQAARILDFASLDVARLDRWNAALVALWLGASGLSLAWLFASLAGLHRMKRELAPETVDDHHVLVSSDVGPALLGVIRSHIVLPRWVLSLPQSERRIILAHEHQHAAAFDPAMVYAAALALALQPWNLALWAVFARFRLALEADCDRRVLGITGDVRRYGTLLVEVCARTTPSAAPHLAFVERASNLERRIRHMTHRPRLRSVAGASAVLAATVLSTAAWTVSAPVRRAPAVSRAGRAPLSERPRVWQLQPVVTVAPRTSERVATVGDSTPIVEPSSRPTPMLAAGPGRCMHDGRLAGPGFEEAVQGSGCAIDGEMVVLALDTAHILVAIRDTADAARQAIDFMVFAVQGRTPTVNGSAHLAGHAELRGRNFYFTAGPGYPAVAFGQSAGELQERYPDATRFVFSNIEILRRPAVTWDVLRQLPGAARCTVPGPKIIVDGTLISDGEPSSVCFVVGGRPVTVWSPS